MDTLDQWQAQAKEDVLNGCDGDPYSGAIILALIDLVRAKDLALNRIATSYSTFKPPSEIASEALALTDGLK